ncbi:MAG: TetR/AcrR family transcriptional regulator [Peptostreptococcaceae bacterium]
MKNKRELSTRELILESAKENFMGKGYYKSRTKEIAENAGVSEALLFKYFKNKDGLYQAFQEYAFDITTECVLNELKAYKSPMDALLMFGKGLLEPDENTPPNIALVSESLKLHQIKFTMTIEHSNYFINKVIVPIVKQGQLKGEICNGNPIELAEVYLRFILGSSISKYYFNASTPDNYIDIILKIFK